MPPTAVLQVAVPGPLSRLFDYLPPEGDPPAPGTRVRVPFGRRERIGVVVGQRADSTVAADRLRAVTEVLDPAPLLPPELMELARRAADYYHHPLGEVLATVLPAPLRKGRTPGAERAPVLASRAAALANASPPELNSEQLAAARQLAEARGFRAFLLQGVTGSGKTEVYLDAARRVIAAGRQVLVLVPEIGLTPQLLGRFEARLDARVAVLHSGLAAGRRLAAWRQAADGTAGVIVGTRSAVFVPMPHAGLIVVDEEHDPSFKQQDGFRYNGRDLALLRARRADIPVVLGSATPSLESLANVERGAYERLRLDERAAGASQPVMELIDIRGQKLHDGLSKPLIDTMEHHLAAGEQVLLFINRRGWAPTLICDHCGQVGQCRRCDARMTVHFRRERLCCHHCGAERPLPTTCEDCGSQSLVQLGQGTERIEAALAERFPDLESVRIDRDSTRRKGELDAKFARIRSGEARILLGTQMLAKGHDFPAVTLVGVLDADGGLFSTDFRGPEHLTQTILQVAGRAGRAQRPGRVLIQTRNPEHPLLRALVRDGYPEVARQLLAERRAAGLPPATRMAIVRAESPRADAPGRVLQAAREEIETMAIDDVMISGPAPAPMERLAGRYRAQLVLEAQTRAPLHEVLGQLRPWLETAPQARRARWSIDVDPVEIR